MALVTANYITNEPRGSQARGAAEAGSGALVFSLSRALTAAGSARGTTAAKAKTVNTTAFTVAGKFYSLAATDDFWTLSGTTVAVSSFQKYALLVDTSGTASIQEATQASTDALVHWRNVSAFSGWAPFLSIVGSTKAIVCCLTIATSASVTFVPGTTNLNAAGITATFTDGIDQSLLPVMGNETGAIVGLLG